MIVQLFLLDMVAVRVPSTAVDTVKKQMPKILFLFLSEQGCMLMIIQFAFRKMVELLLYLDQEMS